MKLLLPTFALLLFTFGCKKYEAEYAVNCQFSPYFFSDNRTLIVTNSNGEVLKTFEVPENGTILSEQFSFSGKDVSEQYDLHLIEFQNQQSIRIFSHLDVPNGASVYFLSHPAFLKYLRPVAIQIENVESLDSLEVVDSYNFDGPAHFSPVEKRIEYKPYVPMNQGLVLRLLANGESQYRHLYLPDSLFQDTISVAWQDFKPESKLRDIELPPNQLPSGRMEVTAVSSDFNHYTTLAYSGSGYGVLSTQFNHPDGLPEPMAYRIRVEQVGNTFEKIFQPGEALRFEPADMAIENISVSGTRLSVRTSGQIDMLRADINTFSPSALYDEAVFWQIEGRPESFENHLMPVFSEYLPEWYNPTQAFKSGIITASQFGNHDYAQIREGFPYRLNEPFAVARSGYRAVWKYFQ